MNSEFGPDFEKEAASFVAPPDVPLKPSEEVLRDVASRREAGLKRPDGPEFSKAKAIFAMEVAPSIGAITLPEHATLEQLAADANMNKMADRIVAMIRRNSEFPVMNKWVADLIQESFPNKKGIEAFSKLIASKLKIN